MTGIDGTSGPGSYPRPSLQSIWKSLRDCRAYFGFSVFLAVLDLIIGIVLLSRVDSKTETVNFALVVLATFLSFGHFVAICFLFQRRLEQKYGKYPRDAKWPDVGFALGIVFMFILSGICMTVNLPAHCYAGKNKHLENLGRLTCNLMTTMATFSWLSVLLMIIAAALICKEVREAIELAKQPPPVFPSAANPLVMRWLSRTDTMASQPTLVGAERQQDGWKPVSFA